MAVGYEDGVEVVVKEEPDALRSLLGVLVVHLGGRAEGAAVAGEDGVAGDYELLRGEVVGDVSLGVAGGPDDLDASTLGYDLAVA